MLMTDATARAWCVGGRWRLEVSVTLRGDLGREVSNGVCDPTCHCRHGEQGEE